MTKLESHQTKLNKVISFSLPITSGTLRDRANQIPLEKIVPPNMPVGVFLQEAFNIYSIALEDREVLESKGLNWGIVEELPERIELLKVCESEWWKARYRQLPSEKEFVSVMKTARKTRDELLRDLEFIYSDDKEKLRFLKKIHNSKEQIDFNIDMLSIEKIADASKIQLAAIGSDPKLQEEIHKLSNKMIPLYADYMVDKEDSDRQVTIRDSAFTLCAVSIEEIRRCAKYAFFSDPKSSKGYFSEYFRRSSKSVNKIPPADDTSKYPKG